MMISTKPNRRIFKEFEWVDLFPYTLSVVMLLGYIYIMVAFLDSNTHF